MVELADAAVAAHEGQEIAAKDARPWAQLPLPESNEVWIGAMRVQKPDFLVSVAEVLEGKRRVSIPAGSTIHVHVPESADEQVVIEGAGYGKQEVGWPEFIRTAMDVVWQHQQGSYEEQMRDVLIKPAWNTLVDMLEVSVPRRGRYPEMSQAIWELAREESRRSARDGKF